MNALTDNTGTRLADLLYSRGNSRGAASAFISVGISRQNLLLLL